MKLLVTVVMLVLSIFGASVAKADLSDIPVVIVYGYPYSYGQEFVYVGTELVNHSAYYNQTAETLGLSDADIERYGLNHGSMSAEAVKIIALVIDAAIDVAKAKNDKPLQASLGALKEALKTGAITYDFVKADNMSDAVAATAKYGAELIADTLVSLTKVGVRSALGSSLITAVLFEFVKPVVENFVDATISGAIEIDNTKPFSWTAIIECGFMASADVVCNDFSNVNFDFSETTFWSF